MLMRAVLVLSGIIGAARYTAYEADYNINVNKSAVNVLDYHAEWPGHSYTASPENWRFPFYSFFLDRYADGDPTNNNANGTHWEFDIYETQFRAGGDIAGLVQNLDYLQSMGIKGIYIIGTPYLNLPWEADQYAARDFTILDRHLGTIDEWRAAVDAIHQRGMYLMIDVTIGTLSDYLGYVSRENSTSYANMSTPLNVDGYRIIYKDNLYHGQTYVDFGVSNQTIDCKQPVFYNDTGEFDYTAKSITCFDDDFAHYGDMEAFGIHANWERQLAKFASVQDRLAVWRPSVAVKLFHYACMLIDALDVDAYRIDKATQMTAEFLGDWSEAVRACAVRRGKNNFFIPGEITGGNHYGSTYLGRGRTRDQFPSTPAQALSKSDYGSYIRDSAKSALDSSAFHYSCYRFMESFLGVEGDIYGSYDISPIDLSAAVSELFRTNDLTNANTGKIDPRHLNGMSNHDIFRWPAIVDGVERSHLGLAMMTLMFPGIPLLYYGEEQDLKLLDNTAANYIFGRQPMFSSIAWQLHGCYNLGSAQYSSNVSWAPAQNTCYDDTSSMDHFNPAHPVRNTIKQLYHLRNKYPTLQDGWTIQVNGNYSLQDITIGQYHNQTWLRGLWSAMRRPDLNEQNIGTNQTVWFLYSNMPTKAVFNDWDCSASDVGYDPPFKNLLAPFDTVSTTRVRNLLYPYEEYNLTTSTVSYSNDSKAPYYGCIERVEMDAYSMKVLVQSANWEPPIPAIVSTYPTHDQRILANSTDGETIPFMLQFSEKMNCEAIQKKLALRSFTLRSIQASFGELTCNEAVDVPILRPTWAAPRAAWQISGSLENVYDGVHWITLDGNYTTDDKTRTNQTTSFGGAERVIFRKGLENNPLVFAHKANWSDTLIQAVTGTEITLKHAAIGATKYRYSTNWQSSWSNWIDLESDTTTVTALPWHGTKKQGWKGVHVSVQYWCEGLYSSHHIQHADTMQVRRWPHIYAQGLFNRHGYDGALNTQFEAVYDTRLNYTWKWNLMTEWPTNLSLNIWGINPDGKPDSGYLYGDLDHDYVLDRVYPGLIQDTNLLYFNNSPPAPHLSWQIQVNDATQRYWFVPRGQRWVQILIYLWFLFVPFILGVIAMLVYAGAFNKVIRNRFGAKAAKDWFAMSEISDNESYAEGASALATSMLNLKETRRKILIATLEYDIPDLSIKIKIGGLGVMAQLMGSNLKHQDLIWVVPMVGDVDYPIHKFKRGEEFEVQVSESTYGVECYYYISDNVTYVLLSSPVFAKQTKADPYPPRMDDLESAVFYSAWNQCIAKTCKRFPIDLYHINDYHGAMAPLYLLPKVIPCALSLHNAEFQGLWPLRKPEEKQEVCAIFNISDEICCKYVQFGNTFNLLHAGVSYLRLHQQGFGAVGVSDKYGARSLARYPIFWCLKGIGKLPNPDPSDTGEIEDDPQKKTKKVEIDWAAENKRKDLKREAQEWAGLKIDPEAQLLVFVGRWSVQKGIDLIADLAPTLLEDFNVQLVTIGPVVDLHGKFAAEKLAVLMDRYPGRLVSKPVFTACPPALFSGADFALIPSRDEPFGLVAVEFGRKGALGIGCRVGGLGTMPGWWYTMNSASASHLLSQFEAACRSALSSSEKTRAQLRARAAKQRFPVAVWVKQLDALQHKCIKLSNKHNRRQSLIRPRMELVMDEPDEINPQPAIKLEPLNHETFQRKPSVLRRNAVPWSTHAMPQLPEEGDMLGSDDAPRLHRQVSLGSRRGPHRAREHLNELHDLQEEDDSIGSEHSFEMHSQDVVYAEQQYCSGQAPEEQDFDRYMRSYEHQNENRYSLSTGEAFQYENHRQEYRNRYETRGLMHHQNDSVSSIESSRSYNDFSPERMRPLPTPQPLQSRGRPDSFDTDHDDYMAPTPGLSPPGSARPYLSDSGRQSRLSVLSLGDLERDERAQHSTIKKGETMFTDANGAAKRAFVSELQKGFTPAESKKKMCIETYLIAAEKEFFESLKSEQIHGNSKKIRRRSVMLGDGDIDPNDRLTGMQRIMAMRGLGWPLYTVLIALGQVLAANTYQLTLLGGLHNTTAQLYLINFVFIAMSVVWYVLYRRFWAMYTLSIPFLLYSIAFILIGLPYFKVFGGPKSAQYISNAASTLYAAASASGSLFFALNFGSEGGVETEGMVFRACIVQGLQQLWSAGLWYWGHGLDTSSAAINKLYAQSVPSGVAIIVWIIGCFLFIVFLAMLTGLPRYYRQTPGVIPAFYRSLYRRKVIVWFLFSQILSNFWLALPYGSSWYYLWSSQHIKPWLIALMIIFYFVIIWAVVMLAMRHFSKTHTWVPVIFALGTIAPRYFAEYWAVSSIGAYLPWATSATGSAFLGRALWLWLTVLDSCQGVGLGIMLLQTLIRDHVAFTLVCAQMIGAFTTVIAKAADISFSNYLVSFSSWSPGDGPGPFGYPGFWLCLICQLLIPFGFFLLFRKSQLAF